MKAIDFIENIEIKDLIWNENCFKTMQEIDDKSVDLILTSPPYLDDEVPEPYYDFLDRFVKEAKRISTVLLMLNSSRRMVEICRRYDIKHILIWDKVFTLPAFKYEPIFVITDDKIFGRGRIYRDVLKYMIPRNKVHINENPVELYEELLRFFPNAKLIYDPFMGSGTTALAAINKDRLWFGSEIDPKNVEIARNRINAVKQTRNT